MAAKLPLLQQCERVSFYKYVTKRKKMNNWNVFINEMNISEYGWVSFEA